MAKITRVQIPVSPENLAILQAFAKAQSATVPAVTATLIEQTIPIVIEMTKALELAKTAPAAALRHMTDSYEILVASADQQILDLAPKPRAKVRKKKTG